MKKPVTGYSFPVFVAHAGVRAPQGGMALMKAKSLLPLAFAGGGLTGAAAAIFVVRRELRKLRSASEPDPGQAAAPPAEAEEISPEILAVISAAVSAFLGKTARVRGVRPARAAGAASPWSQQGRVYIQGSHVLVRP
jgi:hypothetical protein